METGDRQEAVEEYLRVFAGRDLPACLEFYAPDATVYFQSSEYRGKPAIEKWHSERFAANLTVVRLDRVAVENDRVFVDAVVTSNRLKAWKLDSITGTVTITFDGHKIKEMKFGIGMGSW